MFFNHSKCFSRVWGGFICYSDVAPRVSGPAVGRGREQHSKENTNLHLCKWITSESVHWGMQILLTCWSSNQTSEWGWGGGVGQENVCRHFSENFTNCWFARNFTHYHLCSVQKMVQYHSRNKWKPKESLRTPCSVGENDLSTAGARGECANWSRWSQITWISNLNRAIYLSAFMLFVRRHLPCFECSTLSSQQTVSSRFWLMAVSLSTKLQTMLVIPNSFFQVQFYSLLESRKRRTKDLMVKVSHVNYCNSLPPLLTPNPKLTAAAVKRAVWMINKDH